MKQILINNEELQTRVAIVENGRLEHFFIEREEKDRLVGSIFKGRVRNLEASLQAAFVDIGTEKNAFLHYWDMLPATKEMLEKDIAGSGKSDEKSGKQGSGSKNKKQKWKRKRENVLNRIRKKLFSKDGKRKKGKGSKRGRGRRGRGRGRKDDIPFTVDDIPDLFGVNSEVVAQVTKGPIGKKGARVTTNLSIPGRYLVLLPNSNHIGVSKRVRSREERRRLRQILRQLELPKGMGLICRTVGAGRKMKHFQSDLDMLLGCWSDLERRLRETSAPSCVYREPGLVERCVRDTLTDDIDEIVVDNEDAYRAARKQVKNLSRQERVKVKQYRKVTPFFDKYKLASQIDNIFQRRVSLPSKGYICVDETEALVAIDVNSGRNRKGKDHPETILTTNMEALEEVARQLRLRNIGGLIVIDFIDMRSKKDRHTVFRALKDALAKDRAKTKAYPITQLGLVEMTRQREHQSLRDTVHSRCPYCRGKGLVKSATSMSVELQRRLQVVLQRRRGKPRIRVAVHPHLLERLKNEDASLLTSLEKELGGELSFRANPDLHCEEFLITDLDSGKDL